jgi:hypothetical protein
VNCSERHSDGSEEEGEDERAALEASWQDLSSFLKVGCDLYFAASCPLAAFFSGKERERVFAASADILSSTHSSHHRLIGRGVPNCPPILLMYSFSL